MPLGLRMLGPALIVLGVMLPWGASSEAQGLDRWGLMVLLVGVPALLLPWAARETVAAHRILAGLALVAAAGALGEWITAWQAVPTDIPDPAVRVGKGPLFTLAGVVLTWATLPGPLKGWHRALVAGGGFGVLLAMALGISAWLSTQRGALAAMGNGAPAFTGTPWMVIEVRSASGTPTIRATEPSLPVMPTPTSQPPAPVASSPEPSRPGSQALPTATPWGATLPAPTPGGEDLGSPWPAPTATVPPLYSPLPTPTPPLSPLSP